MTALWIVFTAVISFEVGWLVSWYLFDRKFYKPLEKAMLEQQDTITKFLDDNIAKLKVILEKIPKKEQDGSMKSPIQINPEQL